MLYEFEVFLFFFLRHEVVGRSKQVAESHYGIERSADFVAHIGEERFLDVGLFHAFAGEDEFFFAFLHIIDVDEQTEGGIVAHSIVFTLGAHLPPIVIAVAREVAQQLHGVIFGAFRFQNLGAIHFVEVGVHPTLHKFAHSEALHGLVDKCPERVVDGYRFVVSTPHKTLRKRAGEVVSHLVFAQRLVGCESFLGGFVSREHRYRNREDNNQRASHYQRPKQHRVFVPERQIDDIEIFGNAVERVIEFLGSFPIGIIILFAQLYGQVGGFCAAKQLGAHYSLFLSPSVDRTEISAHNSAVLSAEEVVDARKLRTQRHGGDAVRSGIEFEQKIVAHALRAEHHKEVFVTPIGAVFGRNVAVGVVANLTHGDRSDGGAVGRHSLQLKQTIVPMQIV